MENGSVKNDEKQPKGICVKVDETGEAFHRRWDSVRRMAENDANAMVTREQRCETTEQDTGS